MREFTLEEQIEAQVIAIKSAPREFHSALEDVLGRLLRLRNHMKKLEGLRA